MQKRDEYAATDGSEEIGGEKGAAEQLEQILACGLPPLYRRAYRILANAADAEDALQDALLAAYTHLNQFRGHAKISTWLTTIVLNCARLQLRRRPRHIHASIDESSEELPSVSVSERLADNRPNPEDQCRESELRAQLSRLNGQLSPTLRRTFQLRDVDGLSIRETAQILGVPRGTVKAQSARARKRLQELMRRTLKPRSIVGFRKNRQASVSYLDGGSEASTLLFGGQEMTERAQIQVPQKESDVYASREDFHTIFDEDLRQLYQLSFLLTRDPAKAELCLVVGVEDCVRENPVFREWARSWAKRVIVQNAIREMKPRPIHSNSHLSDISFSDIDQLSNAPDRHFALEAVLNLEDFERFVFVISVLEHYSDHDCVLLLGCSVREILEARACALKELMESSQEIYSRNHSLAQEKK